MTDEELGGVSASEPGELADECAHDGFFAIDDLIGEARRERIRGEALEQRSTRSGRADAARRCSAVHAVGRGGGALADKEHPKGALLFILVFLALIVGFWINTYLRLWLR